MSKRKKLTIGDKISFVSESGFSLEAGEIVGFLVMKTDGTLKPVPVTPERIVKSKNEKF